MLTIFRELQKKLKESSVLSSLLDGKKDTYIFNAETNELLNFEESSNTVFDPRTHDKESIAKAKQELYEGQLHPDDAYRLKSYKVCWNICIYVIDFIQSGKLMKLIDVWTDSSHQKIMTMLNYLNTNTWVVRVLDKETYELAEMLHQTLTALSAPELQKPFWYKKFSKDIELKLKEMQDALEYEMETFLASQEMTSTYHGEIGQYQKLINDIYSSSHVTLPVEEESSNLKEQFIVLKQQTARFFLEPGEIDSLTSISASLAVLKEILDKLNQLSARLNKLVVSATGLPDKEIFVFVPFRVMNDAIYYEPSLRKACIEGAKKTLGHIYQGKQSKKAAFDKLNVKQSVLDLIEEHIEKIKVYAGGVLHEEVAEFSLMLLKIIPIYQRVNQYFEMLNLDLANRKIEAGNIVVHVIKCDFDLGECLKIIGEELSLLKKETFQHKETQKSYEHFLSQIEKKCQRALHRMPNKERSITDMLSQAAIAKAKKEQEVMISDAKKRFEHLDHLFKTESVILVELEKVVNQLQEEENALFKLAEEAETRAKEKKEEFDKKAEEVNLIEGKKKKLLARTVQIAQREETLRNAQEIISYNESTMNQDLQGDNFYLPKATLIDKGLTFDAIADALEWELEGLRQVEKSKFENSIPFYKKAFDYLPSSWVSHKDLKDSPRVIWMGYIRAKLSEFSIEREKIQHDLTSIDKTLTIDKQNQSDLEKQSSESQEASNKAREQYRNKLEICREKKAEQDRQTTKNSEIQKKRDIASFAYDLVQLSPYLTRVKTLPKFMLAQESTEYNLNKAKEVQEQWVELQKEYTQHKCKVDEADSYCKSIEDQVPLDSCEDFELLKKELECQQRNFQLLDENIALCSTTVSELSDKLKKEQDDEAELSRQRQVFLKNFVSKDGPQLLSLYIQQRENNFWWRDMFSWMFACTLGYCMGYQTERDKRRDYVDQLKTDVEEYCTSGDSTALKETIQLGQTMFKPRSPVDGSQYPLTLEFQLENMSTQLDNIKVG